MSTAGAGARDQVARLLTLVPMLHARDSMRLEQAAQQLGVSTQQIVKDLKVLLMCGLPGGYPDDLIDVDLDALEGEDADGVIRVSNAEYLSRPLRLTPTEATALIVALRAIGDSATEQTREVVTRTLEKLERAAADGHAPPQVALDRLDGDIAAVRRTVEEALQQGRQLRLTYWVPTRDEASERVVDPWRVLSAEGHDYLEGWCHSAEDRRLFRLDRVHDLAVLSTDITKTAAADLPAPGDLPARLFQPPADGLRVTLRLRPGAHWVPEYYPVDQVRRGAQGGEELEVDLVVSDERWLHRLVLRLAPHADVVSPPEAARGCLEAARRTLAWYE